MTESEEQLFIIHNGNLYSVNKSNAEYNKLSSGWSNTKQMVYKAGNLFMIDGGSIYKVNPADGEYAKLSNGWDGSSSMC